MPKLSIIIVNYNTYSLSKQTIDSILNRTYPFEYEIILVDNASSDGSIEMLKDDFKEISNIHIIINKDNLGFGKANNIGYGKSTGEYILLLNSDTVVGDNCLTKCMDYIEQRQNIGALGCKVMLEDGTLDHACKRGFPTPKASLYYFLKLGKKDPIKYGLYDAMHLGEDEVGEVDVLTGAFMLMPKEVIEKVGLFDEDYFMYGEDIDLCYKIKEAGYDIVYYPEAHIYHLKGGSSKKKRTKVIYNFHDAMWIFYRKHYINKYNMGITILVWLGIWNKYILELVKNLLKKKNAKSNDQNINI